MSHIEGVTGEIWRKGDEGYESARRAAVWHGRKPGRYPDVIVRVASEQDVVAAVRYAREQGLKVKARGGGHSFTASSVRNGLLIDFSAFREVTVDPDKRTATVTPGVQGSQLGTAAGEHGLFFPVGHHRGVGLGGYLLQGGFGWNGRSLGPACASVRAIDVVTANGKLVHSDDTTNPDYVWAARGAGSGFFGVVTRYYVDLYPAPASIVMSTYVFPLDAYDDVVPWFLETASGLPRSVEPGLFCGQPPGRDRPVFSLLGVSFAESEQHGRDALAAFEACPFADRALMRGAARPVSLEECYDFLTPRPRHTGDGSDVVGRYCCDGMWTNEPPATLVPQLKDMFMTMPTRKCGIVITPWRETEVNGSFSMQAPLYLAAMAVWDDEADDERCGGWATSQMRRLEPLAVGIQLADENLINRPAPFMAPENLARLEELRAKHDPAGLFHSHLLSEIDG